MDNFNDIVFGRDDLLAVAEQICYESGISSADGEVLCEELARTAIGYLNWCNEEVKD